MILWDSRLVHQGGVAASARASQAVAPSGQQHRGCYGRMVAYMCRSAVSGVFIFGREWTCHDLSILSLDRVGSSCGVLLCTKPGKCSE